MPLSKVSIPLIRPCAPLRARHAALARLLFWAAAIAATTSPNNSNAQHPEPPAPTPPQNQARENALSTRPTKRPLRWEDFDGWRSISSPTLSPDGHWLAYSFMPARGDGEVIVRQLPGPIHSQNSAGAEEDAHGPRPRSYHVNAGEIPPPPFPQGPTATGRPPPPKTVEHLFTGDSQFLLSLTFPSAWEQREARLRSDRIAADPLRGQATDPRKTKQSLTLIDLAAGRSELVPEVQSVQVSLRGSWVAYLHEPVEPPPFSNSAAQPNRQPSSRQSRSALIPSHENRRLVLRELLAGKKRGWSAAATQVGGAGQQKTFEYVSEYSLARDGRTLLFLVDSPSRSRNGLYAYTPGSTASPQALLRSTKTDVERLSSLTWDARQTQAAFLIKRKSGHYDVGLWRRGERAATIALSANTPGLPPLPPALQVGEYTTLGFSNDGKKLYVGLIPRAATPPTSSPHAKTDAETRVDPLERAHPEIWRWDDERLPPRREVLAEVERPRTYAGVLDLETGRYLQIGGPTLQEVHFSEDGLWALGFDETPYLRLRDHDATYADVYTIDTRDGSRRLIVQKLRGTSGDEGLPNLYFSPTVKGSADEASTSYAAYFDDGHWWAADLASGATQNLTAGLPVSFAQELHDKPEPPPPYGWAGWTADARSLVVYDRYDLWQLFISKEGPGAQSDERASLGGKGWRPALNLTGGLGRSQRLILRVQDTAQQHASGEPTGPALPPLWARGLDTTQPLTLRGEDERTRDSGFFRQHWPHPANRLGDHPPLEPLLWGEKNTRFVGSTRPGQLLFTASRFDEFPDLWVSDADFSAPQRVSDGGAQLAPFAWGRAPELIDYRNTAGTPLNGLLYTPPDFDPAKSYPLIVYLYERLSSARHGFFTPSFGANLNLPYYTSNGYLVYLVDIAYEIGAPGPSALDSVHRALDALIARGDFVDPERIGIQGSSWGGYQVATIVMHSDRFRAAVAGSPVSNMTSAYGGIRWRSGRARLFQYEQSQSRIGAALTEAPERYVANSPIFAAHQLRTPLLLLHNDGDGVVPWQQSTQLFLTLRRHEKPVWFINYPYETHEIARYANRRDFQKRAWAFFEHHLRGGPKPDWMHPTSAP